MRTLDFYYDISLRFSDPVSEHDFLLRCLPPSLPEQTLLTVSLTLEPSVTVSLSHDAWGNPICTGRAASPHSSFRYTAQGRVLRDDRLRQSAPPLPVFRYPSPRTQPSREMAAFLNSLSLTRPPLERAWILARAVREHFTYTPGATGVDTCAADAFALGRGVCQDYAHVFLTLARQAGLPARYVVGLPEGEGVSHAWAEIWADGLWHGIDPTRNCPAGETYLKLAVGRDFGDCPVEQGIFRGISRQEQSVFMRVTAQ